MARFRVKLDHAGIRSMLQSDDVGDVIAGYGERVAALVEAAIPDDRTYAGDVEVRSYTTDRAAVAVSIAHPAGLAAEARNGYLIAAATAAGLEIGAGSGGDGLVDYISKAGKKSRITAAQAANYKSRSA